MELDTFIAKWTASEASERSNKAAFLIELCDVLGVMRPEPASGNPERDLYCFERDVVLVREGSRRTLGRIDLYRHGCFLLEAKQGSDGGSRKRGLARRGTSRWHLAMQEAFGQAWKYTRALAEPPPFLVVCDIGYCFDLYAAFDGSPSYRPYPDGQSCRFYLKDLATHRETLRQVFEDPASLDPSRRSTRVTREVALHVAELARELHKGPHDPGAVATFLMRCLFTMFAEDVGLLPERLFSESLERYWRPHPVSFVPGLQKLWVAMRDGGVVFPVGRLRRFGGRLFSNPQVLQLTAPQLELLLEAASHDWAEVDPAIFGTLLEQALQPEERQRLGAHFTPREYVERLVRPTVEEPLREAWNSLRAGVYGLVREGREREARRQVREFHGDLCRKVVLDPACGSGNFLYVTLEILKRLEAEVLSLYENLGGPRQGLLGLRGHTVTPDQLRGLEVDSWARGIAELVLWIGYLQWQIRTLGGASDVPEPVLGERGSVELRDALLDWDDVQPARDPDGAVSTRWDGHSLKPHPVTGAPVPDASCRRVIQRYLGARRAAWPKADFVVGNPPFIGNWRMRSILGDGYVEALRRAYPEVPESCDYVMYWWERAAQLLAAGKIDRFGLITTNSVAQAFNRRVLDRHVGPGAGASLAFAVPDHPWVGGEDGAAVRIAMTVARRGRGEGRLEEVVEEREGPRGVPAVRLSSRRGVIHPNLSTGPDLARLLPLAANEGLCCPGVKLHGAGFLVTRAQAEELGLGRVAGLERHLRPYLNGRDLAGRPRDLLVIDLFGVDEDQVRSRFPEVYQWLLERVKPERELNNRASYRERWWVFGEPRSGLRPLLARLPRFVATPETAKHRFFTFVDGRVVPDNRLVVVATDDPFVLGVLSSRIHRVWALAAGGSLEDRPVYNKTLCFDPFPFPDGPAPVRDRVRELAEGLDAHRKRRLAAHPALTLTATYNLLETLRAGAPLSAAERRTHDRALGSLLLDHHRRLDEAVAQAYGWRQDLPDERLLEHLLELNRVRREEEAEGFVRSPGPRPRGTVSSIGQPALPGTRPPPAPPPPPKPLVDWPAGLPERNAAVREILLSRFGALTLEQIRESFGGIRRRDVEAVLENLAALGLAVRFDTPAGRTWQATERIVA